MMLHNLFIGVWSIIQRGYHDEGAVIDAELIQNRLLLMQ